jgi:hypothetical protein
VYKFSRNAISVASLLVLTACQTAGTSPSTISKIQAAGYQSVTHSAFAAGKASGWSIYTCSAEKCGQFSIIAFATKQSSSNSFGETYEAQLRNNPGLSRTKIQAEFAREYAPIYPSLKITALNIYQRADQVGMLVATSGKTPQGDNVYSIWRTIVQGNTFTFALGAGLTPAVARKALNLAIAD